ncbi:hypothetical protein BaRGS_00019884, partial [Batillaria attramentaria]
LHHCGIAQTQKEAMMAAWRLEQARLVSIFLVVVVSVAGIENGKQLVVASLAVFSQPCVVRLSTERQFAMMAARFTPKALAPVQLLLSVVFVASWETNKGMTVRDFKGIPSLKEVECSGESLDPDEKVFSVTVFKPLDKSVLAYLHPFSDECITFGEFSSLSKGSNCENEEFVSKNTRPAVRKPFANMAATPRQHLVLSVVLSTVIPTAMGNNAREVTSRSAVFATHSFSLQSVVCLLGKLFAMMAARVSQTVWRQIVMLLFFTCSVNVSGTNNVKGNNQLSPSQNPGKSNTNTDRESTETLSAMMATRRYWMMLRERLLPSLVVICLEVVGTFG